MATNKKIATKKPAKKAVVKKTVKPAVKKVVAKKAAPAKKTPKKAAVPVKKVKPKKAEAKKVVAKKATTQKKTAPQTKKASPAKKTVLNTIKKVAKPVSKTPVKQVAPPEKKQSQIKIEHKVVVKSVEKKLAKNIKEEIVAIKKPEKKKEQPVKEVKIPKTTTKTSKPYKPDYKSLEERINNSDKDNMPINRYSDAELEEFREIINKKLADATQEVTYLQGIITRKDEMGSDSEGRYMTMEDGTVSMEREQMSQMVSRQITFIDNLKKALIRIENKTYGICRVTGKLIDKARLRAVPHATLSLEAKMGLARSKEQ
ncbi:MAG: TraR/DksA C4-type zinc finger protein [Arachidicoccus sp.]|nr:TraR/DksA C4-type zinc finger protein [Arachidicoccus sp.]